MKQLCWCAYHTDALVLRIDLKERVKVIKETKPANEIPIRLHEFQVVKGELPQEVKEACITYSKARDTYKKAEVAFNKAWDTYSKAWDTYSKAEVTFKKAWDTFEAIINKHRDYLEKLHREQIPDTVWNGTNLVFDRNNTDGNSKETILQDKDIDKAGAACGRISLPSVVKEKL